MRRTTLVIALLVSACQTSPNTPLRPEAVGDGPVTFNKQVVRVFQRNCQTCHRPGEVAPFSLTNYKDAHARRDDIREAVESRYMPPWKAVPGHGEFADVRRLSEDEIRLVARWVADGAPEGEPRDLPSPRRFPIDDWDFEWQIRYVYKRPVPLPAGTRIVAECVYDNPAANPKNPSKPPRPVFSGFETTDEMCLASVLGTARIVRR